MLEKLGIYGMEKIERAILAGLVTGDPILLVGTHGAGKTLLSARLAKAMGLNYWAYDASKALFEDVLGFPDPSSLASGQIEYVPTPISIWGKEFVLIDELSRANPAMQNKWLEVIRSRRIMGKDLDGLKYIIAAMNPPSYVGAHPLDPALAGRFAFVVTVPEVSDMSPEAVSRIVRQVSEDDAPMLKAERPVLEDSSLNGFVDSCRERTTAISGTLENKLSEYVLAVNQFLTSREIGLDGRRLGMLFRNLKAYIAVMEELEGDAGNCIEDHEGGIAEAITYSVPFAAMAQETSLPAMRAAHQYAKAALNGGIKRPVLVLPKDPMAAKEAYISRAQEIPAQEAKAGLTSLISRAKNAREPERKAPAVAALADLCADLCEGRLNLLPDDENRLLSYFMNVTLAEEEDMDESFRSLKDVLELERDIPLENPEAFYSFRLALNATEDEGSRRHGRDENAIARLTEELLNLIRSKEGEI